VSNAAYFVGSGGPRSVSSQARRASSTHAGSWDRLILAMAVPRFVANPGCPAYGDGRPHATIVASLLAHLEQHAVPACISNREQVEHDTDRHEHTVDRER